MVWVRVHKFAENAVLQMQAKLRNFHGNTPFLLCWAASNGYCAGVQFQMPKRGRICVRLHCPFW